MRAGLVAVLVLAAGCVAEPDPPVYYPEDDGLQILAYPVLPIVHPIHREGAFRPLVDTDPWRVGIEDATAAFWRVNVTLSWDDASTERPLKVDVYALRRACPDGSQGPDCQQVRRVGGAWGRSPQPFFVEVFPEAGESALRVEAGPASSFPSPNTPQVDFDARLEGEIRAYHPSGDPIEL